MPDVVDVNLFFLKKNTGVENNENLFSRGKMDSRKKKLYPEKSVLCRNDTIWGWRKRRDGFQ
jgi:hypothetical protein